jgi:hypothetical protein
MRCLSPSAGLPLESPLVSGQKGGAVKPWYRWKEKEGLRLAAACGSLTAMLGLCRAAGALALLLGLAGCGLIDPFETGTPDSVAKKLSQSVSLSTGEAVTSTPTASTPTGGAVTSTQRASAPTGMTAAQDANATAGAIDPSSVPVSVCYNRLSSTPRKVIAIAAQECGPDKPPSLVEQKWDLYSCPLMTPVRATFVCGAH